MNRIEYFEETLERCESALKQDTGLTPLEWIINQLKYLIAIEKGSVDDFSKLDKINIGWIAVREMDWYEDKDLIHSLCVVSSEAEKMILEKKQEKLIKK